MNRILLRRAFLVTLALVLVMGALAACEKDHTEPGSQPTKEGELAKPLRTPFKDVPLYSWATGDFNGDGKADLLWYNKSNGQVDVWFMNGTSVLSGGSLGMVPTDWQIAGVGDLNGDGKADLLWYNKSNGRVDAWFMNGTSVLGGGRLDTVSADWQIAGV